MSHGKDQVETERVFAVVSHAVLLLEQFNKVRLKGPTKKSSPLLIDLNEARSSKIHHDLGSGLQVTLISAL